MDLTNKLLLDRLTIREEQIYQQADAIDVKASILLVATIFFAGQTINFLHDTPRGLMHYEQLIAAFIEVVAGATLARLLRTQKTYIQEPAEEYLAWIDDIVAEGGNPSDAAIEARLISEILPDLSNHCAEGYENNKKKGELLIRGYWTAIVILILNVAFPILRVLSITS